MGHQQSKKIPSPSPSKPSKPSEPLPSPTLEDVVKEVQRTYISELEKLLKFLDVRIKRKTFVGDVAFRGHNVFDIPLGCEKQAIRDIERHLKSLGFETVIVQHRPYSLTI